MSFDNKQLQMQKQKPHENVIPVQGDLNWAEEVEERDRRMQQRKNRPDKRTRNAAKKQPGKFNPTELKAVKETAPKDAALYDLSEFSNSAPSNSGYVTNIDMSGLFVLFQSTYNKMRDLDTRLERQMSFAVFQHVMASRSVAHLIRYLQDNNDLRFVDEGNPHDIFPKELKFPAPIWHALTAFGNCRTPGGENVRINVPIGCLPGVSDGDMGPGYLGEFTDATAQRYMCYISPAITKASIVRSQTGAPENPHFPFPAEQIAGAVYNENLLGYRPREFIAPDFKNQNDAITFSSGDNMAGRLCYSEQAEEIVNRVLGSLSKKMKMIDGFPPISINQALLITSHLNIEPGGPRIADYVSQLTSAYQSTAEQNCQAALFSLRRKRSAEQPGVPIAAPPANRAAIVLLRNLNYEMGEGFAPSDTGTSDFSHLRTESWLNTPAERSRAILSTKWMTTKFLID